MDLQRCHVSLSPGENPSDPPLRRFFLFFFHRACKSSRSVHPKGHQHDEVLAGEMAPPQRPKGGFMTMWPHHRAMFGAYAEHDAAQVSPFWQGGIETAPPPSRPLSSPSRKYDSLHCGPWLTAPNRSSPLLPSTVLLS